MHTVAPPFERRILRDVEHKCRFTHGRAARNDHEIAALQARGELIEIGEPGRDARKFSLELHQLSDAEIGVHGRFFDRHERVLGFFHGDVENAPFGIVEHLLHGPLPRLRIPHDVCAGADELAHDAAVFEDVDIMGNVCSARHEKRKLRDIRHAAHSSKLAAALERVDEGNAVHGIAVPIKLQHGGKNILVRGQIEILRPQRFTREFHPFGRNEHAAEHAFFRFQAVRQHPRRFTLFHGNPFLLMLHVS